ncbi:MAG: hypothetical protein ABSH48_27405, partial [Verrucomicrobiota bacterium]
TRSLASVNSSLISFISPKFCHDPQRNNKLARNQSTEIKEFGIASSHCPVKMAPITSLPQWVESALRTGNKRSRGSFSGG